MTSRDKDSLGIAAIFGEDVFSNKVMKERLPEKTYQALQAVRYAGGELDLETADVIAHEMKDWAIEQGAIHFTHWFPPLTGTTAEKHDSFITAPDRSGRVLMELSGKELV